MNDIPIIGAPRIGDWFFTAEVTCPAPCSKTQLLHGKPGAVVLCHHCKRGYQLQGMPRLSPDGMIQVPLGVGEVTEKK